MATDSVRIVDPVFDRDRFLFREKHLAIAKKYVILDEEEQPILYVERPARVMRRILAVLAGIIAAPVFGLSIALMLDYIHTDRRIACLIAFLAGVVILFAVSIGLAPRRHVTIYRDECKKEVLLKVLQAWKWGFIARHTVTDAAGEILARIRKNRLYNFVLRKRWQCHAPDGSTLCIVKEDSAVLSLLRQLTSSRAFGALKVNFILFQGETDAMIGDFTREIDLRNRYMLDLQADPSQGLDRRVAVAIGIVLDMDEKPWIT